MMKPKVSVLTTVYNREKYLRECLESVQAGRFQDYEHIVVDDGSTDDSQSIAQEIAQQDERIQFHVNPSNLGDYPNRNRAASMATGEYIKYLDADDWHGRSALHPMMRERSAWKSGLLSPFVNMSATCLDSHELPPRTLRSRRISGQWIVACGGSAG